MAVPVARARREATFETLSAKGLVYPAETSIRSAFARGSSCVLVRGGVPETRLVPACLATPGPAPATELPAPILVEVTLRVHRADGGLAPQSLGAEAAPLGGAS